MSPSPANVLTQRHLELVAMFASGKSYGDIAEAKFMHYNTVRRTLEQARQLVGAESLVDLCIRSAEAGVITRTKDGYVPQVDPYVAD